MKRSTPNAQYPTTGLMNHIWKVFRNAYMNDVYVKCAFVRGAGSNTQHSVLEQYRRTYKGRFVGGAISTKLLRRTLCYAANKGYLEHDLNNAGCSIFKLTPRGQAINNLVGMFTIPQHKDFQINTVPTITIETTETVTLKAPVFKENVGVGYKCPGPELTNCNRECDTCLLESENFHKLIPQQKITKDVTKKTTLVLPKMPGQTVGTRSLCQLFFHGQAGPHCNTDNCGKCAFGENNSVMTIRALMGGDVGV